MPPKIIRRSSLPDLTGLSIATIYRLIKRGEFPSPVKLSAQAVGWRAEAIQQWIASREAA